MTIKSVAIAAIAACVIGAGAAYGLSHDWGNFIYHQRAAASVKTSAKNVARSLKEHQDIERSVALGNAKAEAAREALHDHNHELVEKKHEADPVGPPAPVVADPSEQLDNRTTCLLNTARAGASPSAACGSDGESAAPSGVEVGALIESDADVAARYNELATRHNALVDWVNGYIEQQSH